MKKLLGILTLGLAALAAAPVASAHPRGGRDRGHSDNYYAGSRDGCSRRYVEYSRSCGGPAYVETYIAYYDDYDRPVYRTRVIPVVVREVRHCPPPPPVYCPPHREVVVERYDSGPRLSVSFSAWR